MDLKIHLLQPKHQDNCQTIQCSLIEVLMSDQQQADGGKQKWWRTHCRKRNEVNEKLF